ncbi:MAG: DNA cytosine methyltransferase [Myxococcota bacterium]
MRTRQPIARRQKPVIRDFFERDIHVDAFAGCGGASHGTAAAIGRPVDIAINHDPVAIAVHEDNSPFTEHYRADIFSVDPVRACRGRHVRHLHASPDCRHHSRASGGAPKSESVRALADVVPNWARAVRPDVITLENVPEFEQWGPLNAKGKVIKERRGELFVAWKAELEALGYVVEHRVLSAHHYGAPTSRRRFYLVARCDGQPIRWPEPTHGPGLKPFRTAAECIDWSLHCPSIFERKKPLADATLTRVATGIVELVLKKKRPFVVSIDHRGGGHSTRDIEQPLSTISTKARHCLVSPSLVKVNHQGKRAPESLEKPLTTVTAARRGHALVAPTMVQTSYGEREGQRPRVLDLHKPLTTIVAGGQKHALVETKLAPFVAGCGGRAAQTPPTAGDAPIGTITTKNDRVVVAPTLALLRNNCDASSAEEPTPTVCAGGNHLAEVETLLAPFIAKHYGDPKRKSGGGVVIGQPVDQPLGTVTTIDHHSFVGVRMVPAQFGEEFPNARRVLPFLIAYYGNDELGQVLGEPLRTITTRDRFALVIVVVDGTEYALVDIGLRMLEPHELLRAQEGRRFVGVELNPAYAAMAEERSKSVTPSLFLRAGGAQ